MVVGHADEASLSECIAHCYWAVVAGVRRRAKERRGEFQFSRGQDFESANYLVRLIGGYKTSKKRRLET